MYGACRQDELRAWGWPVALQGTFLDMQFAAQSHAYAAQFDAADDRIVAAGDQAIGRLWVHPETDQFRLVDIALLPEHQGHGLGHALITDLQSRAAKARLPVSLTVRRDNRAHGLYTKLGFRISGQTELDLAMIWTP